MIINYIEFDIDKDGSGVLYITADNESGYFYYAACKVFNNSGLRFDLENCEIIGCMDSKEQSHDDYGIKPRQLFEDCLAELGVKTMLRNIYWHEYKKQEAANE